MYHLLFTIAMWRLQLQNCLWYIYKELKLLLYNRLYCFSVSVIAKQK